MIFPIDQNTKILDVDTKVSIFVAMDELGWFVNGNELNVIIDTPRMLSKFTQNFKLASELRPISPLSHEDRIYYATQWTRNFDSGRFIVRYLWIWDEACSFNLMINDQVMQEIGAVNGIGELECVKSI